MQPRRSILPPMPQLRSSHAPGWVAVARGTAAGLALLLIGGLAEQRQWGTSLVDGWLFSLAPLPETAALALVAFTAPLLLLFFAFPGLPQPLRLICFLTVLACCGFIGREVWQATEQTSEQIRTAALAQPLGLLLLFVVTGLGVVGCGSPRVRGRSSWFAMLLAACLTVCSFPVLSIQTAAVRPVAVDFNPRLIVVPLCPNTETGELSESLLDRLQTAAAELRRSRRARLLLCGLQQSGRLPAEGQLQAAAAQLGIAAERLQIDLSGLSLPDLLLQTAVPANSSTAQPTQVLLVSHWYELSRLRLLARRAGVQPATVAARQQHALFRQNQLIAEETLLMLRDLASPVIAFARQSRIASETILDTETAPSDLSGPSDPATPGTDPAVNPADPFRQL